MRGARLAPMTELCSRYRQAGKRTAAALVERFLTPIDARDGRPVGMLVGSCFNKRRDSRAQDSETNAETIFGNYYLFEALNILDTTIEATSI